MKKAIILASGLGRRAWPYSELRSKVMIPICNEPVIQYTVSSVLKAGFDKVVIVAGNFSEQISNYYRNSFNVEVVNEVNPKGTAFSVYKGIKDNEWHEYNEVFVFYGDTIIDDEDMKAFITAYEDDIRGCAALVSEIKDKPISDFVCCDIKDSKIVDIVGHPRNPRYKYVMNAFAFNKDFVPYLKNNSCLFTSVQVGMMPPLEGYIEMSLKDYMEDGLSFYIHEAKHEIIDVDKPWDILYANSLMADKLCSKLKAYELAAGAAISCNAAIDGKIKLGKNSRIGRNVIIKGNAIIGDNTIIDNGAILSGNNVIGNNCVISDYCYLSSNSVVGNNSKVMHCAEFEGVMMDHVYLYHYMEFSGVLGSHVDLGAATVCGTLRFDDEKTVHNVNGKKEKPNQFSNCTYLGDYSRTGVNAILMPGSKTGVYSVVGPGVILNEDLPSRTIITAEQVQSKKSWGPEKYGW
jgi:bifunctional UDP-N-acetylglucosamine pyrophosphorylase/glucosamine-1-phosphate N-acetyltransferase